MLFSFCVPWCYLLPLVNLLLYFHLEDLTLPPHLNEMSLELGLVLRVLILHYL